MRFRVNVKFKYFITILILLGFFWKFYVPLDVKEMSRLPLVIFEHNFLKSNYNYKLTKPDSLSCNQLKTIYISADSNDNSVIQKAINNIDSGIIYLIDSIYIINSPIVMKSNIFLVSLKKNTKIIRRGNLISTKVLSSTWIGDSTINMILSEKQPNVNGQQFFLGKPNSGGWNRSIFKIIGKNDNAYIAKLVFNKSSPSINNDSYVNTQNSFIFMNNVKNSGLKFIEFNTEDVGNMPKVHSEDFLNAGIVILNSDRIFIDSVKVNNYFGEGISVQGGKENYFSNIECSNNFSHGFHLGTGVKETIIINSRFSKNKGDGIYFCAQVNNCIIENNIINLNLNNGIGGLGGSGDRGNKIVLNSISFNKKYGIHLYETGNKISNNIFIKNYLFKSNNEFGNLIEFNSYEIH